MSEITVLMTVYNGMPYLPIAVGSILNQTVHDLSFVIINDGSTDESKEYLDNIRDERVKVLHQSNKGQGAAKNFGLTMCHTKFVALMDCDDVALPTRLEEQVSFLLRNKEVGALGTQIACLGANRKGFSPPLPLDHDSIYADLLRGRHAICQPSLMCQASVLKAIGGYRIDGSGEDWDMFLRMGEASKLTNLNKVLLYYRLHSSSVNVTHLREIRMRIGWACQCAKLRAKGKSEITFHEFIALQRNRPYWQHLLESMDIYALSHYRHALVEILSSQWIRGYPHLIWAVLSSPRWSAQRVSRTIQKRLKK